MSGEQWFTRCTCGPEAELMHDRGGVADSNESTYFHCSDPGREASQSNGTPPEQCEMALTFEATCPIFEAIDGADGAGTPGSSPISADHHEQFGGISGTVSLGARGRTISDAASFRDHFRGPAAGRSTTASGWSPGLPTAPRSRRTARTSTRTCA
ncbi:hypothetical protein AB0O86_30375 [Streptomyces hirsutus]|uniref:hypothetical protein n=1 Tax=Streptomyces hirsutus TaxID=35620 RepID=UPI0034210FDD